MWEGFMRKREIIARRARIQRHRAQAKLRFIGRTGKKRVKLRACRNSQDQADLGGIPYAAGVLSDLASGNSLQKPGGPQIRRASMQGPVSYTHLTLPTKRIV